MNKLILCEGKTDAILLSYYLEKTCGWAYCKAPKGFTIRVDEKHGESACWYRRENEYLLICGVGGKNNFKNFFREKIKASVIDANAFSKIAVVTDRDEDSEHTILEKLLEDFNPIVSQIHNQQWVTNYYENSFKQQSCIDFLLVIIPPDKEGALESLLLEAISENVEDKALVERNIAYIEEIQPIAVRYISKKRLKLKACLGVTWAIQYPEKLFSYIDEQITSVSWENSQVLSTCFAQLLRM